MDYVVIALYLVGIVFVVRRAFGRGADDSAWEARWGALDPLARMQVERALDSPTAAKALSAEERELFAGLRRRRSRRRAYIELSLAPLLIVLGAFALTGVIGVQDFNRALSLFLVAGWLVEVLGRYRRKERPGTAVQSGVS